MGTIRRTGRSFVLFVVVAAGLSLLPAAPATAHGTGAAELLYDPSDPYLSQRVQEITDTNDVLLAVEWAPTVDGVVNGVAICLDLSPQAVNSRLPLAGYLWTADGALIGSSGASEGISIFISPCFYGLTGPPVRVHADQHYVVGFLLRGGQYSYVPHGFDNDRPTTPLGHLTAPSTANSTVGAGNGLFSYTSSPLVRFPTENWESSDYLVSPLFTPDPH